MGTTAAGAEAGVAGGEAAGGGMVALPAPFCGSFAAAGDGVALALGDAGAAVDAEAEGALASAAGASPCVLDGGALMQGM